MIETFHLEEKHLSTVVDAHMTTWAEDDLSVQLGKGFLEAFYRLAIEDSATLALGTVRRPDAELSCWCLGYRKYHTFNARLRRRMGLGFYLLVARRLLSGKLRLSRIRDHFFTDDPDRKVQCPDNHLGAFGRVGGGFEEVFLLSQLIAHTAAELCSDEPACWAVTNDRNRGGKMIMEKAGFKAIDSIVASDRTLNVYEFEPAS